MRFLLSEPPCQHSIHRRAVLHRRGLHIRTYCAVKRPAKVGVDDRAFMMVSMEEQRKEKLTLEKKSKAASIYAHTIPKGVHLQLEIFLFCFE